MGEKLPGIGFGNDFWVIQGLSTIGLLFSLVEAVLVASTGPFLT